MTAVFGKITEAASCAYCHELISADGHAAVRLETEGEFYIAAVFHQTCLVTAASNLLEEQINEKKGGTGAEDRLP